MEKQELSLLEDLSSVSSQDKVLGYSEAGDKFGFIPLSFVTNEGYACRRWNMANSTDIGEAVGNIDYLRRLPSLLGLGCYLVDRNHGRRKLDPTNHYKFATGEAAALDGSMGDYQWGWGTKWYYAWWTEGSYYYEAASLKPIPGRYNYIIPVASTSALGVSVVDRENLELVSVVSNAAKYRGGNNDATKDAAYNTQLGRAATSLNAETFGSYARKKGDGWEAYWYTFPATIGALFRIIKGTRKVDRAVNPVKDANGLYQGGAGPGVLGASTWWTDENKYAFYPFLPTSVGVELADGIGVSQYAVKDAANATVYTANVPVWFGLKNFFGYIGRFERGRLISKNSNGSADIYVLTSMRANYSMNSLAGMIKAATAPAAAVASTWEYITQLSMQNLCHTPTVTGGTESTYYCDGYYNDNASSGLRVPAVGGIANDGGAGGLESLAVHAGVTTAHASYGSPLCEAVEDWDTTPVLVPA